MRVVRAIRVSRAIRVIYLYVIHQHTPRVIRVISVIKQPFAGIIQTIRVVWVTGVNGGGWRLVRVVLIVSGFAGAGLRLELGVMARFGRLGGLVLRTLVLELVQTLRLGVPRVSRVSRNSRVGRVSKVTGVTGVIYMHIYIERENASFR